MNQTLAITGASGFLGRCLLAECARRRTYRLRLLTRNIAGIQVPTDRMLSVCEGDLVSGYGVEECFEPQATVVHLAYVHDDPQANIDATSKLIDAARASGVRRVIHCSTAVVVGFSTPGVITEKTPVRPRGWYQEIKWEIEQRLCAGLPPSIELSIIRPTEIIGPGGIGLGKLVRRVRGSSRGANAVCHAILGSRRFNYVSVHNVVEAILLLAGTPIPQTGDVYQVSDDDDPDNTYEAVESIIRSSCGIKERSGGVRLPRVALSMLFKMLLPDHAPPDRVYSTAKLRAFGYRPVTTLRSAVRELVTLGLPDAHS
jgi:nucleoside-diphosphate-sugar epimerase